MTVMTPKIGVTWCVLKMMDKTHPAAQTGKEPVKNVLMMQFFVIPARVMLIARIWMDTNTDVHLLEAIQHHRSLVLIESVARDSVKMVSLVITAQIVGLPLHMEGIASAGGS